MRRISTLPPELRPSTFEVYAGVFGAATSLRSTYVYDDATTGSTIDGLSGSLDGVNPGFGLRGGADYVTNGWVLGAVADWTFAGDAARDEFNSASLEMQNLGTLRARAGLTMNDMLFYVTGGFAQAELSYEIDNADATVKDHDWASGWTVGAGFDFSLSNSLSLGVEYLYVQLEDQSYPVAVDFDIDHDLESIHTVRVGLDYAFQI